MNSIWIHTIDLFFVYFVFVDESDLFDIFDDDDEQDGGGGGRGGCVGDEDEEGMNEEKALFNLSCSCCLKLCGPCRFSRKLIYFFFNL